MLVAGAFGYPADFVLWLVLYASLLVHTWCFFRFFPRQRKKLRLGLGNLLIFLCLLATAALIGESYYRFTYVATDAFGLSLPSRRWFALYGQTNSLGCRDVEWRAGDPAGVRRIAFVGDSFTYGWGVPEVQDRFTELLAARLTAQGQHVEVMNVAKPGWDTGQQLQPIIDLVAQYGVDEVVLCYVLNDVERILPRDETFNPIKPPQCQWFNTDSSILAETLWFRLFAPRAATVRNYHAWLRRGYTEEDLWRQQQTRLGEIIMACRDRGVPLRVVLLPYLRTPPDFDAPRIHAQLADFFQANEVPCVDLLPVIAGKDTSTLVVNPWDPHPNEQAHELFADAIWKGLYGRAAADGDPGPSATPATP